MQPKDAFYQHLRSALNHFYDRDFLRQCLLAADLGMADRFDTPTALQKILTDAIETLKPPAGEPLTSKRRQIYDILSYHYIQQFKQDEVAHHLGVSERHLRRVQGEALDVLACDLWDKWRLEERQPVNGAGVKEGERPVAGAAAEALNNQEWAWLKDVHPRRTANMSRLLQDTLALVQPMAAQRNVTVTFAGGESIPDLYIDPVSLRQIVLNLLGVAIQRSTAGQVAITLGALADQVEVRIYGQPAAARASREAPANGVEASGQHNQLLAIAQHLAALSGGRLEVATSEAEFDARLRLPLFEGISVLVIDDNEDILHLLERYIEGHHYSITGVSRPADAIDAAITCKAQIIVLDVMMPGIDGWEMLGRLRQHPGTAHVPVIILTILAQEELALSLGARAFVLKPVSQESFLAALERVAVELKTVPG